MSSIFNTTLATRSPVISGEEITASSVNRQLDIANGIEAQVTLLAGSEYLVTTSTAVTLTPNKEIYVVMNNTSNATVALPSALTAKKSIIIEKGASNYNIVTVNRAGSDTINNPYNSVAAPVGTNFILYLPGESYEFTPMGTYWRVTILNAANEKYRALAVRTTNQALGTGTVDKIQMQTETYDLGSFYDNVTNFRFTPLINGLYDITARVSTNAGTNGSMIPVFYRNASTVLSIAEITSASAFQASLSATSVVMNGTTDWIDLYGFSSVAGKSLLANNCECTVSLRRRLS